MVIWHLYVFDFAHFENFPITGSFPGATNRKNEAVFLDFFEMVNLYEIFYVTKFVWKIVWGVFLIGSIINISYRKTANRSRTESWAEMKVNYPTDKENTPEDFSVNFRNIKNFIQVDHVEKIKKFCRYDDFCSFHFELSQLNDHFYILFKNWKKKKIKIFSSLTLSIVSLSQVECFDSAQK